MHIHQNMGDNAVRAVFECGECCTTPHWNKKLDLCPEKRLLAASARRTFATVGDKYTARCIICYAWCSLAFPGRPS